MTDREKLIELLKSSYGTNFNAPHFAEHELEPLADHLIANGVTVQQWIPVTERLPEPDKEVLLIAHGWQGRMHYTGCLHRCEAQTSWLTGITSKASDWKIYGWSYLREPNVTHWMPLPQPPKGE